MHDLDARRGTMILSFRQTKTKFGPTEASNARQRGLCRRAAKLRCVYTLKPCPLKVGKSCGSSATDLQLARPDVSLVPKHPP